MTALLDAQATNHPTLSAGFAGWLSLAAPTVVTVVAVGQALELASGASLDASKPPVVAVSAIAVGAALAVHAIAVGAALAVNAVAACRMQRVEGGEKHAH